MLEEILKTELPEKVVYQYVGRCPHLRADIVSVAKIELVERYQNATLLEKDSLALWLLDTTSPCTFIAKAVWAMRYKAQRLLETSATIHIPRDRYREGYRIEYGEGDICIFDYPDWEIEDIVSDLGLTAIETMIVYHLLDGEKHSKIAKRYNITRQAIEKKIAKIKKKWKEQL